MKIIIMNYKLYVIDNVNLKKKKIVFNIIYISI